MVVRVMVDREHEAESVSNLRLRRNLRPPAGDGGWAGDGGFGSQRGSGFPFVSSPKGSSRRPITNATAVKATGVPTVP
jgi:hypothetical protein